MEKTITDGGIDLTGAIHELALTEAVIVAALADPNRDDRAVGTFIDEADKKLANLFDSLRDSKDTKGKAALFELLAGFSNEARRGK